MNDHDDPSDEALDALLHTTAADLLRHVRATTDSNALLTALMAHEEAASTGPDASTLIAVRTLTRNFARIRELAQAYADTAFPFDDSVDHTRLLAFVEAGELALRLARALRRYTDEPPRPRGDRCTVSATDVWTVVEVPRHPSASDEVRALLDRARTRELEHLLGLARKIAPNLALVRRFLPFPHVGHELYAAIVHGVDFTAAISITRTLPGHSWFTLRALARRQVDARGVDLSFLAAGDVPVLADVVWSDETRWSPEAEPLVRALSEELRPSVYRIRGGSEREDADTCR
ncbi:hypothetical protein [Kitasatospora phosalacinea]|uniref:Uncharacterized protein n=1 Tax=Kitasatospora phosalacinea TaxID=2065 RepID=A0A9W6PKW0_9ACTN|nr:hypothetical protein [Kitasatospora phosalacinea]GLW56716.1 hypothetical protein Kpho01_47270 [Kitasatospora phosalacinea]